MHPRLTRTPAALRAVMVKGVKITDADSKAKALARLQRDQALALMETD